jgi:sterol desaturase/sphingolipid hydroxylase (fatty acid hydroxylase superfamily)
MNPVIEYFQSLEQHPIQRMLILVSGMLILWMIEGAVPLIAMRYKKDKLRHATVNFGFTVIHLAFHTGFAVVIILISDWCRAHSFGIVYWTHAGTFLTILITILTVDFFVGWLVHFTEHKIAWMWRFHVVHHADNNVDVTTGLRHHPVESVFRGIFIFGGVFLSGAPMYAVMIYQTFLIIATQFAHANISLPPWLDKAISYIIVSPNMHKVHHHWKQPQTDSNYGAALAIWDRIFGTYIHMEPKDIVYGLDRYYPNEKDEDFVMLLKTPFQKQGGDNEPLGRRG